MTSTDFSIVPATIAGTAQAYADAPTRTGPQADALRAARTVNTGDAGLDATVAQTLDAAAELWTVFGDAFAATADALRDAVASYQAADTESAAAYDDLAQRQGGDA